MIILQENIKTLRDITKSIKSYERNGFKPVIFSLVHTATGFNFLCNIAKMRNFHFRVHPPIKAIVLIYVFLTFDVT